MAAFDSVAVALAVAVEYLVDVKFAAVVDFPAAFVVFVVGVGCVAGTVVASVAAVGFVGAAEFGDAVALAVEREGVLGSWVVVDVKVAVFPAEEGGLGQSLKVALDVAETYAWG